MTFVARELPKVIVLGDGHPLIGPFCDWCGNMHMHHRASDLACPIRRLHPLLPRGKREVCSCPSDHIRNARSIHIELGPRDHLKDCAIYKHGYTGSARKTANPRLTR